jgi:hypothetical protein
MDAVPVPARLDLEAVCCWLHSSTQPAMCWCVLQARWCHQRAGQECKLTLV